MEAPLNLLFPFFFFGLPSNRYLSPLPHLHCKNFSSFKKKKLSQRWWDSSKKEKKGGQGGRAVYKGEKKSYGERGRNSRSRRGKKEKKKKEEEKETAYATRTPAKLIQLRFSNVGEGFMPFVCLIGVAFGVRAQIRIK